MNARREPKIELPTPAADQPPWAKVGIVALIGFVVGVAWPRVVGIQLGPAPPNDRAIAPKAREAASEADRKAGKAPPLSATASAGAVGVSAPEPKSGATVSSLELSRCRDAKGKVADKCDELALDPLFVPRLKELSRCPSALGLTGKVQLGFDLDFKRKTIKVQRAKAKLPRTTIDGLTKCAEKELTGVSLDDLAHEQQRYTGSYTVDFGGGSVPEAAAPPTPDAQQPADPKAAEVVWRSTLVRDAAKTGKVVGRLQKGAKVRVVAEGDGGWVRVEFGEPKQEGWLTRESIGQ